MADIILVTGGARSGKSSFAEAMAADYSSRVLYVATAEYSDGEMTERIRKHRESRPSTWKTKESFRKFSALEGDEDFLGADLVLLDCLSLMLNNWMYYAAIDFSKPDFVQIDRFEADFFDEVDALISLCRDHAKQLIIVTNEIGMGLVPADALSRVYRDLLGRTNRLVSGKADAVYLLISGIPVKIK